MEVYNEIAQAIGTLGFPIVMCGVLVWQMNKRDQEHKEETSKLSDAIDRMNVTLARMLERMDFTHETDH